MPRFDELNQLKRFFSTMEISEEEKNKRIDLAYLFYDAIWYTFMLVRAENDLARIRNERESIINGNNTVNYDIDETSFRITLQNRLEDVLNHKDIPYEPEYLSRLVKDITDTTIRHTDDIYYLSKDRALVIAQNEANSVYNFVDYEQARRSGKQYKTWLTENDEKVRLEHEEVDRMRIPINELFKVGTDSMLYPHDYLNGSPGNLINCRCICLYE